MAFAYKLAEPSNDLKNDENIRETIKKRIISTKSSEIIEEEEKAVGQSSQAPLINVQIMNVAPVTATNEIIEPSSVVAYNRICRAKTIAKVRCTRPAQTNCKYCYGHRNYVQSSSSDEISSLSDEA